MTKSPSHVFTLTENTPISRDKRGAVRAFVRSRPEYKAWLAALGADTRDVSNRDLLRFAIAHNYVSEVTAILNGHGTVSRTTGRVLVNPAPANIGAVNPAHGGPAPHPVADRAALDAAIAAMPAVAPSTGMGPFDSYDERDAMAALKAQEDAAHEVADMQADMARRGFALDAVLGDVEPFLSPVVRGKLEAALKPVLDAANAEPVVITREVERIVVQAPTALTAKGVAVPVETGKVTLGKLFRQRSTAWAADREVTLWDSHGRAPVADPFYVLDYPMMAKLATAVERGANVWLVGPGGSGKTSLPEQFAAAVGRPFVKIGFTKQSEVGDLIGGTGLKGGDTQWDDGVLIAAMKTPGAMILLDEITLAPPGVQGIIQGTADSHRTYTVHATGEVVRAAKGVVFIVADNTAGYGDESGRYAGTHQSNAALVDRFARMIHMDYISVDLEAKALHNHTKAPEAACRSVAEFFARARKLPAMEGVVLSLRRMVALVQEVQDGFPAHEALKDTILNRLQAEERAALEGVASLQWAADFDKLMGSPATGPSHSAGSAAFDDATSAGLVR